METFYDEAGHILGRAYSRMNCRDADAGKDHRPHSHDPDFTIYGPYMCEGVPKVKMFLTPPRNPIN